MNVKTPAVEADGLGNPEPSDQKATPTGTRSGWLLDDVMKPNRHFYWNYLIRYIPQFVLFFLN